LLSFATIVARTCSELTLYARLATSKLC